MKIIAAQATKTLATARLVRRFRSKYCSLKFETKDSLAKGLIPFYIDAFNKPDATSMGLAYGEAKLALINPLNFNKVEIISPSPAMYATYGINSPTGRYIPNDNLEYRDANPRASADGQISIRDANILKIKVTYAYDIDKVPLMATLLRRIMCTGFADQGGVDAWANKGLGQDIPNCAYYLNKKLPIVAYATVQMQSNPVQETAGAGAASPVSPTPTTPPVSGLTPTPPTLSTPTPTSPAPTAPVTTTPTPTPAPIATAPKDPVIACASPQSTAASVQRDTLQAYVTPEEYNAKLAQVPTPLLTMQTQKAIAMGAPVAVVLFCAANPLFCIGSAIIASCAATPACMDAAVKAGGAVLNAVVNACTPTPNNPPIPVINQCKPCSPPAGEKFNLTTHWSSHSAINDPEKGSHGCEAKTGSPVHWHYSVNNQTPYPACQCNTALHKFGGCGPAP